jgi:hypothetical protein
MKARHKRPEGQKLWSFDSRLGASLSAGGKPGAGRALAEAAFLEKMIVGAIASVEAKKQTMLLLCQKKWGLARSAVLASSKGSSAAS